MKKILLAVVATVGLLTVAFFALNNYSYQEKQAGPVEEVETGGDESETVAAAPVSKNTNAYVNATYGYRIEYPSSLELDADVYGGSSDLSKEPHIYLRTPGSDRFHIEVLDPAVYPSSKTLSLNDYVQAVHSINDNNEAGPIVRTTLGGHEAYAFKTNGGFNTYQNDKDGLGWSAEVSRNKTQNFIYTKNGSQVFLMWYPADMKEAESIVASFKFN